MSTTTKPQELSFIRKSTSKERQCFWAPSTCNGFNEGLEDGRRMAIEYLNFISQDGATSPILASIVLDAATSLRESKASEAQVIGFFSEIDAALKRQY